MATPTRGEVFSQMLHHAREFQSCACMMAHLHNTEGNAKDHQAALGWLMIEDLLRKLIHKITMMAQGRLH